MKKEKLLNFNEKLNDKNQVVSNEIGNEEAIKENKVVVENQVVSNEIGNEEAIKENKVVVENQVVSNEISNEEAIKENKVVVENQVVSNEIGNEKAIKENQVVDENQVVSNEIGSEEAIKENQVVDENQVVSNEISNEEAIKENEVVDENQVVSNEISSEEAIKENQVVDENLAKKNDDEIKKDIQVIDLEKKTLEDCCLLLSKILVSPDWLSYGDEFRSIVTHFLKQFSDIYDEKQKEFISDGGDIADFYYYPSIKAEFDSLEKEYKNRRRKYYKSIEEEQKDNYNKKIKIIEEIKLLMNNVSENSTRNIYKRFKDLQQEWNNTGKVPYIYTNNIWQTYKHRVKVFYDFIHLNKQQLEKRYKDNHEEKLKIIEKAKELLKNPNILIVSNELNKLHLLWKEKSGPINKEEHAKIWKKFQEVSKIIHEKKQEYLKNRNVVSEENLIKKELLVKKIATMLDNPPQSHIDWVETNQKIKDIEEEYYSIGYIIKEQNKKVKKKYYSIIQKIHFIRGDFYKNLKEEYKAIENEKKKVIEAIKSILNDKDWRNFLTKIENIKKKYDNIEKIRNKKFFKIDEEFFSCYNTYMINFKSDNKEIDFSLIEMKEKYYKRLEKLELPSKKDKFLEVLKNQFEEWKKIVDVSNYKEIISFKNGINKLVERLKINAIEKESFKFDVFFLLARENKYFLMKEQRILQNRVDKYENELRVLENNMNFFSQSSSNSSLIKGVQEKVQKLSNGYNFWKEKLYAIKKINLKKEN